jgi:hypothetical protein
MSARFIVSNDIDVTIHDDFAKGKVWVEVDVKAAGSDKGVHRFDADFAPDGALKVKDKVGYSKLAHHAKFPLVLNYGALL